MYSEKSMTDCEYLPQEFQEFNSSNLKNYCFWWGHNNDSCEESNFGTYGIDLQGLIYRGKKLVIMRNEGLIIREFREKVVFEKKKLIYIGTIQEASDGTWFSQSPYNIPYCQIFGFSDQFYAIRHLHELGKLQSRNSEEWGEIPQIVF